MNRLQRITVVCTALLLIMAFFFHNPISGYQTRREVDANDRVSVFKQAICELGGTVEFEDPAIHCDPEAHRVMTDLAFREFRTRSPLLPWLGRIDGVLSAFMLILLSGAVVLVALRDRRQA